MRLLITGATGSLGRAVHRRATVGGWTVTGAYFARAGSATATERLDVRDPADVRRVLRTTRPDVVIHTATGRDRNDWAPTADGAAHVAVATAAAGVRLVHVSTDALFSGREVYYDESAAPDPTSRYGAAKAAAETAVRAIAPDAAVIRTSLIMGDGDGGQEHLTRDLVAGRIAGALFTDEIRKPIHPDDLADALLEIATSGFAGILNVAGPHAISRYDLGVLVAEREGLDPAAIPAARVGDVAPGRPADVRLVTDRAEALLKTRLRGAREFLAR